MGLKTAIEHTAALDPNKNPTLTAVSGTAGTSDTTGTAEIVRVGANPATGAMYVQDLAGASGTTTVQMVSGTLNVGTVVVSSSSGGTNINVVTGTQQTLGTIGVLNNGTLAQVTTVNTVSALTTGSLTDVAKLYSGTINVGTFVMPTGTITTGSLTNLANVYNGSVNILTGTLQSSGTVTGVGVVSALTSGSVTLTGGTLTLGTLTNLASGTITALAVGTIGGKAASGAAAVANPVQIAGTDGGGTIYSPLVSTGGILTTNLTSSGTLLNLATGTLAAVTTVTTLSNLTNGSVRMTFGTLTTGSLTDLATIYNLNKGTVTRLETGTLAEVTLVPTVTTVSNLTNGSVRMTVGTLTTGSITDVAKLYSGTINAGTIQVNKTPVNIGTSYHQLGTAGADFWGTIIAASGAGTYQYVSGVQVIGMSGTTQVAVTNVGVGGSTGAGVLARGWIAPGQGIAQNFDPVVRSGTNGTLAYWLSTAGTVHIVIQYWQGV